MVPTAKQITDALLFVSQKHGQEKSIVSLKAFLTRSHLAHLLPAISFLLKKKAVKENLADTLVITSATELSQSVLDKISNLAHKKVGSVPTLIGMTVDKSLVGGFVAVYKGKVFDGSVKTMLTSLLNKK